MNNPTVIAYHAPSETAADYTNRALRLLKDAERLDSRLLWHLLAPSNILALAGLRGYSPYNDALAPEIDVRGFDKFLAERGFGWINENPNIENPPLPSYGLANFNVLDRLHETYPVEAVKLTGKCPERSIWGLYAWMGALDMALARAMESGALPKEWLRDWWSPHNVRFGMVLGYPAPAIATFVSSEVDERLRKEMGDIEIAEGLFDSASVSFAISKAARELESVTQTAEVWKATLTGVYQAYPPEEIDKI